MVANHIADKAQRTKYERALYARSATGNATHLKINSFEKACEHQYRQH